MLRRRRHVYWTGLGLRPLYTSAGDETPFDANYAHTFCNICGAAFQSDLDRLPAATLQQQASAVLLRREWAVTHSNKHSEQDHRRLKASGLFCLPEATHKLCALGVIPWSDIILDESNASRQAAKEAPAVPRQVHTLPCGGLTKGGRE